MKVCPLLNVTVPLSAFTELLLPRVRRSGGCDRISGSPRQARAVREFPWEDPALCLLCEVRVRKGDSLREEYASIRAWHLFASRPLKCGVDEQTLRPERIVPPRPCSAGAAGGAVDIVGSFLPLFPVLAVLYAVHLGLMLLLGPRLGFTTPGAILLGFHSDPPRAPVPSRQSVCDKLSSQVGRGRRLRAAGHV